MFRLIEDSFWDDPQIARLPKDEKLITLCLFTCVHTKPCGIYRITTERIAAMTKITELAVAKGLKLLADNGIAYYDGTEICIPGYIRRQHYKGPQMATRIVSELSQVKNRDFVALIEERYPDYLRIGGHKKKAGLETKTFFQEATPWLDEKLEMQEKKKAKPGAGLADLALFISRKLKLSAGIKASQLAKLVAAEDGDESKVREAVERAVKYYETAKDERWRSFVIAKRFSKFVEFYDEAFRSDDALAAYIEKIRTANDRERRKDDWRKKKDAALHIGAARPEPETKSEAEQWADFLKKLPADLEPLRKDLESHAKGKAKAESIIGKIVGHFQGVDEIEAKTAFFMKQLAAKLRTPQNEVNYRINYIRGLYGIPEWRE